MNGLGNQTGFLDGRAAPFCVRTFFGERQQLEGCLRNDSETSLGTNEKFNEIIAGNVFYDLSARLNQPSIGKGDLKSQSGLADRSVSQSPWTGSVVG